MNIKVNVKCAFFLLSLLMIGRGERSYGQHPLAKAQSDLDLKGAVKTFVLSSYPVKDQDGTTIHGKWTERHYIAFDDDGYRVLEKRIRPDGSWLEMEYGVGGLLQSQIQYGVDGVSLNGKKWVYDSRQNPTQENQYNSEGQLLYRTLYHYNEDNQKVKEEFYEGDHSLRDYTLFQYNEAGLLEEERYHFDAGDQFEKRRYVYDEAGQQIAEKRYDEEDTLVYVMQYRYDKRGNRLEENNALNLRYQGRHSVVKYTYDAQDRKTAEYKETQEGKLSEKILFSYDTAGHLLEEIWYDSGAVMTLKKTMQYDGKGRLLKEIRENGITHEIEAYAYELDTKGNPREILYCVDGKPVSLSQVKITYY